MFLKIFVFFQVYNFLFPIKFSFFSSFGFIFTLFGVFVGIFYCFLCDRSKFNSYLLKQVFIVSFLLSFFSIFSVLYNKSDDYISIVQGFKFFWVFLSGYFIFYLLYRVYRCDADRKIIGLIVFFGGIVAATSILEFFSPSFKTVLDTFIDTSGNIDYAESFRSHGLASSGGAALSLSMALIFILSLTKVCKNELGKITPALSLIVFCSTLFIGRSGLVLCTMTIVVFLITKTSSLIRFLGLVLCFLVFFLLYSPLNDEQINIIYSYSLEPIKSFNETGSFESKTSEHLKTMFFIPDIENIFLGGGYWRYPIFPYFLSDVGYLKVLLGFGLIGFIVFYFFSFFIYYKSYKYYSFMFGDRRLFFILFFSLFFFEIKEAFLIQNYAFKILVILVVSSSFLYNKNKVES